MKSKLRSNENLANNVLRSVLKRYREDSTILQRVDEVFKKQIDSNMIEVISDLDNYRQIYPRCSFLSHFPLLKDDRLTTKVRIII